MFTLHNFFRLVALFEGISAVLLLFVAVPIKYIFNDPQYVKLLGMPHGVLFILYIIIAIVLHFEMNWNLKKTSFILFASIIPFGTFYIDNKYLKKQ